MPAIVGKRSSSASPEHVHRLPKIRNRFKRIYQSHPFRWTFDKTDFLAGGDGWLPVLGAIQITPGSGGVGDHNDTTLALVRANKVGWNVIHENDPRLKDFGFYNVRMPSNGKTAVYCSIFESVKVLGNKVIWSHDPVAYRKFLRFLISSGIVPPMDDAVREMEIDDKRTVLDRMQGRLSANPNNPTLASKVRNTIELMAMMEGTYNEELVSNAPQADPAMGDTSVQELRAALEKNLADVAALQARLEAQLDAKAPTPPKADSKKPVYDDDIRQEAIDLVAGGSSKAEVSRTLNIPADTVGRWVASAQE